MAAGDFSLQYVDRSSPIHNLYPLTKLSSVFVIAIGLFLFRAPRSGAVMFGLVLFLTLFVARVPFRKFLSSSRLIFGLGILLMIFHFFADPGRPIYRIGPLSITDGGLHEGPIFFFRLSVVVLASFLLIWTTEIRDLMISLARAGIPYRYAFAVFLALRFLPVAQREVEAVRAAHAIRGRATRSRIYHRILLWQRYMFTVLINGLRKAEATATAIECRGFGAYPERTYVRSVTYRRRELLVVAFLVIFQLGLILWERAF